MASVGSFIASVLSGYRLLALKLLKLLAASLLLSLLAALIALPLWYLAIRATGLYTLLLGAGALLWILFRKIRSISANGTRKGPAELLRGSGRALAGIAQYLLLLLLSYLAAGGLLRGRPVPGILALAAALAVLGLIIRRTGTE
jgi:hypothetical protein